MFHNKLSDYLLNGKIIRCRSL